jgi:hypothetical protein
MQPAQPTPSNLSSALPAAPFRSTLADAARFWEPRRLIYNLVLATVTATWILATWPHFRPAFTLQCLLQLCVLGLIANVLYCAAYLIDLPMQHTPFAALWKRRRIILWIVGTLLAFVLTNYWISDEIYPFV